MSEISDDDRFEFLSRQARSSRTGISFDWVPSVGGEPSGWRFMRQHFISDPRSNIRVAIDGAIRVEAGRALGPTLITDVPEDKSR